MVLARMSYQIETAYRNYQDSEGELMTLQVREQGYLSDSSLSRFRTCVSLAGRGCIRPFALKQGFWPISTPKEHKAANTPASNVSVNKAARSCHFLPACCHLVYQMNATR